MRWFTAKYERFAAWARRADPDWSPHDVLVPLAVGVVIVAACWGLGLRI